MRKRSIVPATLAASAFVTALVAVSTVGSAWAYFTTNTDATGGHPVSLVSEVTTVEEEFDFSDWVKNVTVSNTSGREVYVRARVFSGDQYLSQLEYEGWGGMHEDGYFYYDNIVEVGGKTSPLSVRVKKVPDTMEDVEEFNVAVVYETTPVQYDAQGNPYADWDYTLNMREAEAAEEGGNS